MPAERDLVEARPLDADAWRRLAATLIGEGRINEALHALAQATHLCSLRSGQKLLEISKLLESLAPHPESVPHQLSMARACALSGFLDRAIIHVEKALEHDVDNVEAHRELAELCWNRGRHEEALDALYRVLWMTRDDVLTAMLLAERLVELNRGKSALPIVRRISDRVPSTGDAELRIGRLLRRCGSAEAALWRLEKSVVLMSESPQAHYELALAYIETGRLAPAIDELLDASRLSPEWGAPMRRLATLYHELGMVDEAMKIEHQIRNQAVTLDLEDGIDIECDDFTDESDLSGRLRLMPVAELLQFLAQRSLTGLLRVSSEKGNGSIEIFRGSVVSADLEGIRRLMRGANAEEHFLHFQEVIGEMINWVDGQIDFVSGATYDAEPKIHFDVAHLLLETIRKLDEAKARART